MANKAVFCIATNVPQAERIVNQLRAAGFAGDDVSVLFPDKTGTRDFAHEQHTKAPEGAATGAGTGGLLGGGLGWLVGIGALAIPGGGPFIAAGPIMAALAGAAVGAAAGGLTGALILKGNMLISVHTEDGDEVDRAKEIFKREGAQDISYTGEAAVKTR